MESARLLRVSAGAALVVGFLSACAPMASQRGSAPVASATALPAPVEGPSDTGFFGIVLFKPLGGFPECPNEASMPYKFHANPKATRQYVAYVSYPCFQHGDEGRIGLAPGGTETIWVKWPATKQPQLGGGYGAGVSLIDGVVHGVNMSTYGSSSQERDYALLQGKFGTPTRKGMVSKQNRLGAKFDIIEAAWARPGGVVISFEGATDTLDSGRVTARSPQEIARLKAFFDKLNEGKPKL